MDQFSVLGSSERYEPFGFIGSSSTGQTQVLSLSEQTGVTSDKSNQPQSKVYPERTSPRISSDPEGDLEFVRKLTYSVNKKKKAVSWLIYKDHYYNDLCAIPLRYEFECLQEKIYCIPYSGDDTELTELHIPELRVLRETEHYALCHRRVGITKGKRLPVLEEFVRIFHPEFYARLEPYFKEPPRVSTARHIFSTVHCEEPFKKSYIALADYQTYDLKKGDIFAANPFETSEGIKKFTYWRVLTDQAEPVYYQDSQGGCTFIEDGIPVTQLSNKDIYAQLKSTLNKAMNARNDYCQTFCDQIHKEAQTYHWLEIPEDSQLILDHQAISEKE